MKNPLSNAQIVSASYDSSEYHAKSRSRGEKDYTMSRSSLKDFAACPSRWIKYGDGDDEATTSTQWGSLIDCLLLEPDKFEKRYAIKPEQYPVEDKKTGAIIEWKDWNANSTWCKNWMAENDGVICISSGTLKEAKNAVEAAQKVFGSIIDNSAHQVYVTAEYKDKDTGLVIPVCGLIDIAPTASRSLCDFKTARDANPAKWPREVSARWYDAQAAMYLDLYNAATGEDRDEFNHLVQENSHPYECAFGMMSVEFINLGRSKYKNALRLYCQCLASGHWATYNDLAAKCYQGRFIIEPESWMAEAAHSEDPDWMTDNQKAA